MTLSRRQSLSVGDRVRYGKYSGKGRNAYIVTETHPITQTSHGLVVIQRCGDVPWTTPHGRTVYLNTAKPATKRLTVAQAADVLTILKEGQRA